MSEKINGEVITFESGHFGPTCDRCCSNCQRRYTGVGHYAWVCDKCFTDRDRLTIAETKLADAQAEVDRIRAELEKPGP